MARRPFRNGTLVLLATIFMCAALIRLTITPGVASSLTAAADSARDCLGKPETSALLGAVNDRTTQLNQREEALAARSQALTVAEKTVRERLAALQKSEDDLAKSVTFADKAADNDVARLVTVYENMKPREAAPLFEVMEPDFAAGFLSRMSPETAAAIMTNLDPKFAYSVSVVFAGRNAGLKRSDSPGGSR